MSGVTVVIDFHITFVLVFNFLIILDLRGGRFPSGWAGGAGRGIAALGRGRCRASVP